MMSRELILFISGEIYIFKVDSVEQIFGKVFNAILIILRVIARKLSRWRNIFSFLISCEIYDLGLEPHV